MNLSGLPTWVYPVFIIVILIIAGAGEYLKLVPSGTFASLLLVGIGLIAPSPAFPHAPQVVTPQATINTSTTEVTPPR